MIHRAAAAYVAICSAALAQLPAIAASDPFTPTYAVLDYEGLSGWSADDQQAALNVFLNTCGDMKDADWQAICHLARDSTDHARTFFEMFFAPVLIQDGTPALFTGYYEPELDGSNTPSRRFRYPVYAMPPEMESGTPWLTRREIEETGILAGRGLEIAWVDDPVELLFLQIQGSGRIRLPDGNHIRLGYAGNNGQDYSSIGQEMVRREIYEPHQVSAKVIGNWVKRNPVEGVELLRHNANYVFFRVVADVPPDAGPKGAMNRSITPGRSLAIDPAFIPLGAPVWIEKKGFRGMRRLMIAQDTGSAIKGPQRADVFMGTGEGAGREAGRMKDAGRLIVLMPIQRAYAMLIEDIQ
jgi:membrane-bound lytic murein transglycosylase A